MPSLLLYRTVQYHEALITVRPLDPDHPRKVIDWRTTLGSFERYRDIGRLVIRLKDLD